jgi:hypothetical protein
MYYINDFQRNGAGNLIKDNKGNPVLTKVTFSSYQEAVGYTTQNGKLFGLPIYKNQ